MGYLDNSSITVDAVLTKKGREILKDGKNLNITSFTLSDSGVDYTLFNSDHPSGSAFYGEAIENLPQLEASVHAEYNLRNRLITLPKGTKSLPSLSIGGTDTEGGTTIIFNDGEQATKGKMTITLIGGGETQNLGYYIVVQKPELVDLRNEEGYFAELINLTNGIGWELRESHCSIRKIAEKYPLVCDQELQLIQHLLPDCIVERLQWRLEVGNICGFKIVPRNLNV